MPHRKKPKTTAKNFIIQKSHYDPLKKENINSVSEAELNAFLMTKFPKLAPSAELVPDGWEPIKGLVLMDVRGEGVFQ